MVFHLAFKTLRREYFKYQFLMYSSKYVENPFLHFNSFLVESVALSGLSLPSTPACHCVRTFSGSCEVSHPQ